MSTYVAYLRRKLAIAGPDLIHTQRAVGYSLRLPRRRMTMRPSALLRRLWRAQLRLRVMADVVIVMLLAIAAFDIGAIATIALPARADRPEPPGDARHDAVQLPSLLPGYPFRPPSIRMSLRPPRAVART